MLLIKKKSEKLSPEQLRAAGIPVFEPTKFEPTRFQPTRFEPTRFIPKGCFIDGEERR